MKRLYKFSTASLITYKKQIQYISLGCKNSLFDGSQNVAQFKKKIPMVNTGSSNISCVKPFQVTSHFKGRGQRRWMNGEY